MTYDATCDAMSCDGTFISSIDRNLKTREEKEKYITKKYIDEGVMEP